MPSTLVIVPTVSLPKKTSKPSSVADNKKPLSTPKKSTSSPSTSKRQRKPKTKKPLSSTDDISSPSSSQTESDDTEKSTNSQKKQQRRRRRQPKQQETMSSPSLPVNMKRRRRSNSAVIYAGPHFMNDAPAPSSLPIPGQSVSLHQQDKQPQILIPQLLHRPTLYERSLAGDYLDSKFKSSHKSYLMDPISEIQEKLRTMLKIQA